MSHREFQRYLERVQRDMEVLRATHDIAALSRKIDRLKEEVEEENDSYSGLLSIRR
jgi:hypothetical protein